MREIKFRVYIKHGYHKGKMIDIVGYTIYDKREEIRFWYKDNFDSIQNNTLKIKNVDIIQYTGLKDKNGKEIYEGDILKHHGIVAWNDVEFRWSAIDLNWNDKREWHDLDYLTSPFEIIGNIYENPELLND